LAEAARWRSRNRAGNPFDLVARDRVGQERPVHPALGEDVAEFHDVTV
jgi:hypothetical protein